MKLEKTLVLQSGRSVRITRCEYLVEAGKSELDVLIKEPNEETFRPLIGLTHPKYWKLKKMEPDQSMLLKLRYSGLSESQLRKLIQELASELTHLMKCTDFV